MANREIKFRCWCDGEMYAPVIQEEDCDNDINEYFLGCDKVQLMQYTGLKDKNGVEIYEGDIVRCPVESPFLSAHGAWVDKEVLYRNGAWIVSYLNSEKEDVLPKGYVAGEIIIYRKNDNKEAAFGNSPEYQKLTVEVIGNIYQNAGLIR